MEELNEKFNELYMKSYEKLFRTAFRLSGTKEEAEDIVQETFLRAYESYPSFRNESSFETWIFRIMLNYTNRYIKKRARIPLVENARQKGITENECWDYLNSFRNTVEDEVLLNDIRETCLQIFFECIPKKQRIAYTLKIFMNFSIKETAEIMGISPNSVKVYIHRAKNHLKDNIDGKCSLLNPKNPCHCQNWLNYLVTTKQNGKIPKINPIYKKTEEQITKEIAEIDFLKRYTVLYSNAPNHSTREEFLEKIRNLIKQRELKIFQ